MKMDFKDGIRQMISNISAYEKGTITICRLKDNLWGIYEFIEGWNDNNFSDVFHKYWDFIEEVYAIGEEIEYKDKIDNLILPELKNSLLNCLENWIM